jgi:hypothetical protein
MKSVKPGGWGPYFVPTAQELAAMDAELAANGLDASAAGDTVSGTLSFAQDPLHSGVAPTLSGGATVANGGTMGTGAAGELLLRATVPTYSATRTRRVRFSPLELIPSFETFSGSSLTHGNACVIDPATGGVTQSGVDTGGIGVDAAMFWPLPKPHNGGRIISVIAYFYVPSQPLVKPSMNPSLSLVKVGSVTNTVTTIGTAFFGIPSSAALWYAGGAPQALALTGLTETVDLVNYVYRISIQDPAITAAGNQKPSPIWTGIEVNYDSIADERFTQ